MTISIHTKGVSVLMIALCLPAVTRAAVIKPPTRIKVTPHNPAPEIAGKGEEIGIAFDIEYAGHKGPRKEIEETYGFKNEQITLAVQDDIDDGIFCGNVLAKIEDQLSVDHHWDAPAATAYENPSNNPDWALEYLGAILKHKILGEKTAHLSVSADVYKRDTGKIIRHITGSASTTYFVVSMKIINYPKRLFAAAEAWPPVSVKIFGLGDHVYLVDDPIVKFSVEGNEQFSDRISYWARDKGLASTHENGKSDKYTIWVPIDKFQGISSDGSVYVEEPKPRFRVEVTATRAIPDVAGGWKPDPKIAPVTMETIEEDGRLCTFIDQGVPVIEIGVSKGVHLNMIERGEEKIEHINGWDKCFFPLPSRSHYHECGTTLNQPRDYPKCPLPACDCVGPKSGWPSWQDLEDWPDQFERALPSGPGSMSMKYFLKTVNPSGFNPQEWNSVRIRNYGEGRGVYFAVSYGWQGEPADWDSSGRPIKWKNTVQQLPEQPQQVYGMDLEKTGKDQKATFSIFRNGKFEYGLGADHGTSDTDLLIGGADNFEQLAAAIGSMVSVVPGWGSVANAALSLLSQAAGAIADSDTQDKGIGWAHEVSCYRLWGERSLATGRQTDYAYSDEDNIFSCHETTNNWRKHNMSMVRTDVHPFLGDFYLLRVHQNIALTGRTTYDDISYNVACKYTNYGAGGLMKPGKVLFHLPDHGEPTPE